IIGVNRRRSKAAAKFLANLSKVYRYVIQNLERNTISISEEVTFLDAYLFLIKMRYGDSVQVDVDKEIRTRNGLIPPISLQLLVENAIKHNRNSKEQPLVIRIECEDEYLIVSNKIAKLLSHPGFETTGIGQKNIRDRYKLLGNKRVVINNSSDFYVVKIPII
ncbi:MAG: sensor histidine kinase, partial [Phocaeicola sp.]